MRTNVGSPARLPLPRVAALAPAMAAVALGAGTLAPAAAGQTLSETQKLLAADGAPSDSFGGVAIDGDRAVVTAPYDDDHGPLSGSAYFFERSAAGWDFVAKVQPSDAGEGDRFGAGVAIDGSRAVVAARKDLGVPSAVYVLERTAPGWVEQAKLTAADGIDSAAWGVPVSLSGDVVVVGAPEDDDLGQNAGAAYVFERTPGGWIERAKLRASDGGELREFGWSVAIDGDRILVGALFDTDLGAAAGAAYVFERVGSGWVEAAKLKATDGAAGQWFGYAVSISGDLAVVGAPMDEDLGMASGAAYVFERTPAGWAERAKVTASDGEGADFFGRSVSASGPRVLVGQAGYTGSAGAYLFARTPAGWEEKASLLASGGASFTFFGSSVALSGERALVGAPADDELGTSAGAAYAFDLPVGGCTERLGVLGLNPGDYACATEPTLGATWQTQVATTPLHGTATLTTILAVGLGGPVEGLAVLGHELLALPPYELVLAAAPGTHALPIPFEQALLGIEVPTQAARIETSPGAGPFLVLTNAQDVVVGL